MDGESAPAGHDFLARGGEMGALTRAFDWAATPLGPPPRWPQSLRTAVRLLLNTRHPMFIFWGPEHIQFYNDAYRATMGPERHPSALGQRGFDCWGEIWAVIGPQIAFVMAGRGATWHEDQLLPLTRHGRLEDVWWTYSYSPIDDDGLPGGVGGVLVVCKDVTGEHATREALRASEARLQLALEASGVVGIWDWDVAAGTVTADARFARLYGVDPALAATGAPVGAFVAAVHPDDRAALDAAMRRTLEDGALLDQEYRIVQADGGIRWVSARGRGQADAAGPPRRVTGTVVDVTERRAAGEALRRSEARQRLALEAGRLGYWELDLGDFTVEASAGFRHLCGLDAEAGLGFEALLSAVHPADRGAMQATLTRSIATAADFDEAYRVVWPDGAVRWLQVRGRLVRAADGAPPRMAGVAFDVTARKEAAALQDLLSREVNHRAKNILAVVKATLRLTRAADLPSYIRAVDGRIGALARAQTLLADDRWTGADLAMLVRGELAPFLGGGSPDDAGAEGILAEGRLALEGPPVALPAGAAQPLAMAVHELATNAVKHGALSAPGGRVMVTWQVAGARDRVLRLRWAETGGPPLAGAPARSGFGSRVLERTVRGQLGGEVGLRWPSCGLVCDLVVPLREAAGRAMEGG